MTTLHIRYLRVEPEHNPIRSVHLFELFRHLSPEEPKMKSKSNAMLDKQRFVVNSHLEGPIWAAVIDNDNFVINLVFGKRLD